MTSEDFINFDKVFEGAIEITTGTASVQSTWTEHEVAKAFMIYYVNEFFPNITKKLTGSTHTAQVENFWRLYIRYVYLLYYFIYILMG